MRRRSGTVLGILLLGTFMAGSIELLAVGLLPLISSGIGVSLAAAGTLVSANALGLAIGGPLLTAATIRLDRRLVLIGSFSLLTVMVLLPALVPDYGWFLTVRLLGGALQGLFMAAAFTTATAIVPKEHTGRAVGIVIAGFSISTVVGLPLGVLGGSTLGWRGTLVASGACALAVTLLLIAVVPPLAGRRPIGGLRRALSPRVIAVLALGLTLFAAPGAVGTYLVPLLHRMTGAAGPLAGVVLVGYGALSVVGSLVGGRLADTNASRVLIVSAVGIGVSFLALHLGGDATLPGVVAVLAWSLFASSAPPCIQYRVVSLAGPSGTLAASLPASAANAGIAFGSGVSGIAYSTAGLPAVVTTGIAIATIAVGLAVLTRRLRPPTPTGERPDADRTDLTTDLAD